MMWNLLQQNVRFCCEIDFTVHKTEIFKAFYIFSWIKIPRKVCCIEQYSQLRINSSPSKFRFFVRINRGVELRVIIWVMN